ncbi:MAG: hypothetical protein K0B14_13545 [Anaerolineaceae bacterium]|nr:hypothetical protein [Anaerolineaceae bacterium]
MKEEEITQLVNKLSEVGVSLNVDTYILAGLLSLASAGLGAFIGSYLKKKGENRAIDEGFSNLKVQLRETTEISESIKERFITESHLYKYRFETYHLRQVEAIEGIYEKLLNLEKHAKSFITSANYSTSSPNFGKAKSATEEYIFYSQIKKIWIPEELFEEIESLAVEIDKHIYSVFFKVKTSQSTGTSGFMDIANIPEAMELINKKVPEAKRAIIQSIKKVLDPKNS